MLRPFAPVFLGQLWLGLSAGAALAEPIVCFHDEGERLAAKAAPCSTEPPRLEGLRGEHIAFQVSLTSETEALAGARVSVRAEAPFESSVWAEHFVDVPRRSRTGEAGFSLAFSEAARPTWTPGPVAEALVPTNADSFAWPLTAHQGERAAVWIELFVRGDAPAGPSPIFVDVSDAQGTVKTFELRLFVYERSLPYGAVSALAFYDMETLGAHFRRPLEVEKETVRLLHAHGVDAFTVMTSPADVDRLAGYFSGAWFEPPSYTGPGAGHPPEVAILGAYGTLGEPTDEAIDKVRQMAALLPTPSIYVYAIDEVCDSPRGPAIRRALDLAHLESIKVAHSCHERADRQSVDLILMPSNAFVAEEAAAARSNGKSLWVYNGALPRSGPMMLDVPLPALTQNGWLLATFELERWFYWESTFWRDGNRGGLGPRDVFADAETFHNADGDVALYDGLLLFPGRLPDFAAHDLGRDQVLPSLRLKALRRGLEDAALLAMASRVDPKKAHAIAAEITRGALGRSRDDAPTTFELDPLVYARQRRALRALVLGGPPDVTEEPTELRTRARAALVGLRERRASSAREPSEDPVRGAAVLFGLPLALVALGGAVAWLLDLRKRAL